MKEKEYIDLGLPSGTLWASENEEGYYTHDEAVATFGDNLPTEDQLEELIDECICVWDSVKKGCVVTGSNGNSIFLPAAGYRYRNGETAGVGVSGLYWSSTLGLPSDAIDLYFDYGEMETYYGNRNYCFSVRLVKKTKTND